jgi:uncharacterized RmlC-like cupin family protein
MGGEQWKIVRNGDVAPIERNNATLVPLVSPANVTTRALWFATGRTEPGAATPSHVHTCETVALVLSGRARFRVGEGLEEAIDAGPGDVIYVAEGVVHTEETLGDEPVEFVIARDRHGGETRSVDV